MASTSLLAALLPLCSALLAPPTRTHANLQPTRAVVNYQVEEGGEQRATPLSDDFDGAVQDAANGLLGAIQDGSLKLRLDFDTSMGDETYTKLKLSTEFARDVAIEWALSMEEDENLVLFFPDAGAAALARQEWKIDTSSLPKSAKAESLLVSEPETELLVCVRWLRGGTLLERQLI